MADDRTVTVLLEGGPLDGYSCVTLESKTRCDMTFAVCRRGRGAAVWLDADTRIDEPIADGVVYRWYRTTTGPAGVRYWYHLAEE